MPKKLGNQDLKNNYLENNFDSFEERIIIIFDMYGSKTHKKKKI